MGIVKLFQRLGECVFGAVIYIRAEYCSSLLPAVIQVQHNSNAIGSASM